MERTGFTSPAFSVSLPIEPSPTHSANPSERLTAENREMSPLGPASPIENAAETKLISYDMSTRSYTILNLTHIRTSNSGYNDTASAGAEHTSNFQRAKFNRFDHLTS